MLHPLRSRQARFFRQRIRLQLGQCEIQMIFGTVWGHTGPINTSGSAAWHGPMVEVRVWFSVMASCWLVRLPCGWEAGWYKQINPIVGSL